MVRNSAGYNRIRFTVIVLMMAVNLLAAVMSVAARHYPLGVAPVLFLIPCLLRELDLKNGRRLRKLGPFEWSCFIGGFLFLAVLPFLIV
jgi:peptidoglycan biosynthesis protein MviN/MurJ (putative lipid II flippase)